MTDSVIIINSHSVKQFARVLPSTYLQPWRAPMPAVIAPWYSSGYATEAGRLREFGNPAPDDDAIMLMYNYTAGLKVGGMYYLGTPLQSPGGATKNRMVIGSVFWTRTEPLLQITLFVKVKSRRFGTQGVVVTLICKHQLCGR